VLALCGCGSRGGANPAGDVSAGVSAAIARYVDALRRGDVAAYRASLAPDYDFNGLDPTTADPFNEPFGITYRSLNYRIESLTTVGNTATATVSSTFEGNMNLEPFGNGRPAVNGQSELRVELEPRGPEWKLTAIRTIRSTFVHPGTLAPILLDFTVNGQIALEVPPGTPLTLAGSSILSFALFASVGDRTTSRAMTGEFMEPWEIQLTAPQAPGRYLASASSFTFAAEPATGEVVFLAGDLITIPVTVSGAVSTSALSTGSRGSGRSPAAPPR
jgi:hypothetical protein